MKLKHYLFFALLCGSILTSCTKNEPEQTLAINMSTPGDKITAELNKQLVLTAVLSAGKLTSQEWKLDGIVKSTEATYNFTPVTSGKYLITYTAIGSTGTFSHEYTVSVAVPEVPVTDQSNKFVVTLFEYAPAAGQFMNQANWGNERSGETILGKQALPGVTLGAFGGYAVYGFDHTVVNQPDKEDIMVYGNAFSGFAEPGVVWVMQDENGNGKPDDTWYELAGSEFGKEGYIRDYEVTYTRPTPPILSVSWKDNKGNTGLVKQSFHKQNHYPLWITTDEFTRKGTLLPSTNIKGTTSTAFAFGYADNTGGGDKVDIANAIDKDGKKVELKGIDFIKIQTGIMADLGPSGELSTEITGIADISLQK